MFDPIVFSSAFEVGEEPEPTPEPAPRPNGRVHRIVRRQSGPLKITRIRSRDR